MSAKGFSVLVADQHSVARAGVKAVLSRERCQVYEAANGRDAVRLAMKHRPQVAVLDIILPEMSGLIAANQIIQSPIGTRVLLLTAVTTDPEIERAMAIHVHGYLCKSTPIEQLSEALRTIRNGLTWFDTIVQKHLQNHANIAGYPQKPKLTEREMEITGMIVSGYSNKDIATATGISEKTVARHRENLMRKLEVKDLASLIRKVTDAGWTMR